MVRQFRQHLSVQFFVLSLAMFLSACSLHRWHEPSVEVRTTLVKVTAAYLTGLMQNNRGTISGYSSLKDLLQHNRLAEDKYFTRIKVMQNSFPGESHPLVGLTVVEVLQRENEARVVLQKANGSFKDQIYVELFWANSGWLVTKESITNDGGLVQKLTGV